MQILYSIRQKTTTALLLAIILGLVMWNNIDQNEQFKKMADALTSLYEDRLIAESYIYDISENLHRKIKMIEMSSIDSASLSVLQNNIRLSDQSIDDLVVHYQSTKFTPAERKQFDLLTKGVVSLVALEKQYLNNGSSIEKRQILKDTIQHQIEINLNYLAELSEIQVKEGKKMNKASKAALISNVSASQFETTLMIIILIIIQMLLFAKKSIQGVFLQKPNLN